jgi:5-methyltetrahydrofolate--homocysteine methyltransferase
MMSELSELYDAIISGNLEKATNATEKALEDKMEPETILKEGLISAMEEVGNRFEKGEYYIPEMLISARAMKGAMALLKPQLVETGVEAVGKVVIGTVQGDLHDIGKNLVGMMLEGGGFEVIDLGTDVSPEKFVETAREKNAQIIGLSALLTTTMVNMKSTMDVLNTSGIRDNVKVIIGGAPVTEAYAQEIGADKYGTDASQAVQLAKQLIT